jgi:uncharacterized membrane protein
MTTLLLILFILWVTAWLALFFVGVVALMAVIALYDWIRALIVARRNERRLRTAALDRRISHAMKDAQKFGWLPREYL